MRNTNSHSIFQSGIALFMLFLFSLQLGSTFVHGHSTKHKSSLTDHVPEIEAACTACMVMHLPLSSPQCQVFCLAISFPEIANYYHPFSQAGYSVPEFAANPKSPPTLA